MPSDFGDEPLGGVTSFDPRTAYLDRLNRHERARDEAGRRSFRLSNLRAATFVACAAALVAYDILEAPAARVSLVAGALLALLFLGQIVVHRRVRRRERWQGALASVAREGLLRLDRDWEALEAALPPAERTPEEPAPEHPYARDLDVIGRASLVRLLGPVTSERGRAVLRSWLLEPAGAREAIARQGAVRELTTEWELRADVTAVGRLDGPASLDGLDTFLLWAESDPWILSRMGLRIASWVLPPIVIGGIVGYVAFGLLPWWILPALAQLEVLRRIAPWARSAFPQAALGGPPLRALVPQLALLDDRVWSDARLAALSERLGGGEQASHRRLERLAGLLDTVESRRNVVYAALAPLLLLDVHLGVALDRWRTDHGQAVRDWLEAAGEWEALSALATLAHDHQDWAHPTFAVPGEYDAMRAPSADPGASSTPGESGALREPAEPAASSTPAESGASPAPADPGASSAHAALFEARALGHPLLHPRACVRNDVTVGPAGTFLFVTGSNMSGKSTLLRAIGTNAVLAAAGAPVCCEALTLPPLRVHTSMRVDDSLAEGVSLFMAELLRIKGIVEAAGIGRGDHPDGRPVLYLLDEILHGTNTAERRVAARGVVRHLVAAGAIGAVSSHDLELAGAPDLAAAAHTVHFREHVEVRADGHPGTRLTFDYRLREGIATTRNALKLLDAVGLGELAREE
jgi:hypothetical protein